ncbi:MAG: ATP-binding cassette domain-containing protein [Porphyromonadaceae bacterium]|nr:MAG: ATP-binding cassette domain-containing protein [Porphyromonadaceae bacterium]
MIEVKNLSKIYSGTMVLSIPELMIRQNESFGLVGNNGAGKTTFFRLLLDLIRANTGWIKSKLKDVKGTTLLISSHDLNHVTELCPVNNG